MASRKLGSEGITRRGAEIFFIEEAIPQNIRGRRIAELPATKELGSALRTLRISTFNDLIGVSLRDLQRVSDRSADLFLELSRLIKQATTGRVTSVSTRGKRRESLRRPRSSSVAWKTEDIKLPPLAEQLIHGKTGALRHNQSELVKHVQIAKDGDQWLTSRILIPVSERGRSLQGLGISLRLSHVFEHAKLHLLGDLHGKMYLEIGRYSNCGRKTLDELRNVVRQIQLHPIADSEYQNTSEATESDPFANMKKKTPYLYAGEIRKTVNMPPALWKQIEERLKRYEPELSFADWVRRIAQDELKRDVRVLGDWLAQPKENAETE